MGEASRAIGVAMKARRAGRFLIFIWLNSGDYADRTCRAMGHCPPRARLVRSDLRSTEDKLWARHYAAIPATLAAVKPRLHQSIESRSTAISVRNRGIWRQWNAHLDFRADTAN